MGDALRSGSILGSYRIVAPLGAGGMGEVYRARDTKLDRDVAIKVLPEAFVADHERLRRFEREARLLAQLHHPNIASIFGMEESGSTKALVMELVEGPTLAERLESGPLPLDESLSLARQIAEALEEAHEKGIIHRDLKPQNIKASTEGRVKVLDFGLAKAMDPTVASSDVQSASQLAASPTFTVTQMGVLLGTAAYMSPEQAKGSAVDKRADIWAFGVVLYEMLAGRRLFDGDSVPEMLAGVLKSEIDLGVLSDDVPPAIRRLLRRCLTRNPRNRLHDIADARLVIEDVLSGAERGERDTETTTGDAARSKGREAWLAPVAIVAIGIGGLATGRLLWGGGTPSAPPMHLAIRLAADQAMDSDRSTRLIFSPDGSTLVFAATENGRKQLFRRRLGDAEAVAIEGTEGAAQQFFSPDGKWIGFATGGRLWKVPAEGGSPIPIAEASRGLGACWLSDGTIVFTPIYSDGLFRVAAEGGTPERLTTPDHSSGVLGHWWPRPLPGERRILFTAFRTPMDSSRVGVLDLDTHEVRWLVDGGFDTQYIATGHLLYAKAKRIYALPFDTQRAVATGPPVPVIDDVQTSQANADAMYAVASDGTLAYVTEALASPPNRLVWLDRQGRMSEALDQSRRFLSASLSRDGLQAATTILGDSRDLWTISFDRGVLSRLTTGPDTEWDPVWTADGKQLIYVVDVPPFTLHRIAVGSPDGGQPLWQEKVEEDTCEPQLSPDGRTLAFVRAEEGTGHNIYLRPLDGKAPARALCATRANEAYPTFSPDGRWVAYESNETGRFEIYAEPADGSGPRIQVSADGGREPHWVANGEIFFRYHDEMRAVSTHLGDGLELQQARTLFRAPIAFNPGEELRTYDVAPDGSRVLAISTPEESRPRQIEVITNWAAQLPRLAPAGAK